MRDNNPLNNFETGSYSGGFKNVPTMKGECPTFSQAIANPLKLIDYIGCHKILLIILLGIAAFLFYSGVKAKAAEGTPGKPGAGTPPKK